MTYIPHLVVGVVVDRNDPERLGRVKVRVPGILEPESEWAYPLGTVGGGAAQSGAFAVPPHGAEVGVLFLMGNPDQPLYLPGHWGKPGGATEVPTPIRDAEDNAGAPDIRCWETPTWLIRMDDRPRDAAHSTANRLTIEHKETGSRLELDGDQAAMGLYAKSGILIESLGLVSIKGLRVLINDRQVMKTTDKPI